MITINTNVAMAVRQELDDMVEAQRHGDYDQDCGHRRADELLCELLLSAGCNEIVELYKKLDKWYS